ncbi:MAG TPA: O-antigen ligase family protein [Bryobacteraceae bacterium]|nr:O-antigen ligase family protein [Bryobacteraceae bacterium]
MQFLPIVTLIAAAVIALRRSASEAFLNVYLPSLFLLPMYYRWVVPALPDPTFQQAAILPIALVFFFREPRRWRFTTADFFVCGLAICIGFSEFKNTGYKEAQNLMFDMAADVVLPYILMKGLIEPNRLRVTFARRLVMLMFAVSVVSVYEFRMGVTPWKAMNPLFPGQGLEWYTTFRYGFARVAGPYGHPILAGLVLVTGFRIQRWLEWSGYWEPRFRNLPSLGLSKARIITLGLIAGMAMTLCRGPWLGGLVGAAVTAIGRAKNRKRALLIIAASIVVVGVPAGIAIYNYAKVGRAHARTAEQETAAYRKELIDKYLDLAMERPVWGYGRNTWPKIHTAPSIDNYYLLLTLMHGLVAVAFLVAIMIVMVFRLIRFELRAPPVGPPGSSLGFTLAGIYIAIAITIGTVYLGLQTVPLFAIVTGWAEGYLTCAPAAATAREAVPARVVPFAFRRVVV